MTVSTLTFVVMVISAILVVLLPFSVFLVGIRKSKSKLSGFFGGILCFIIALLVRALIWTILNIDNIITLLLGTDVTVNTIRETIMDLFQVGVESTVFYLFCRWFTKKENSPFKAIRASGGFVLADTLYNIILIVIAVVVMIGAACGKEYSVNIFSTMPISADSLKFAGVGEYLFKVLVSCSSLCVIGTNLFLMYTGIKYDAKWLLFIGPLLQLGIELPYSMSSLRTVWLWGALWITAIAIGVVTIISVVVSLVVYKNYYKNDELYCREYLNKKTKEAESLPIKESKQDD